MMGMEIVIECRGPLLRAAVVDRHQFDHLYVDRTDRPVVTGAIVLGVVDRVLLQSGRQAAIAFVRMAGLGEEIGFLPKIDRVSLKPGDPVLVQVRAPGRGAKGPRLTQDITVTGRYLVFRPCGRGATASRRFADPARRDQVLGFLKALPKRGGWIVRSGAATVPDAAIEAEAVALAESWETLNGQAADSKPPCLLAQGPDAIFRCLVEHGGSAESITVADQALATACRSWLNKMAPESLDRVRIRFDPGKPGPFELRGLEDAFDALFEPVVPLAGGASLVIEPTTALVAVDINGGDRGDLVQLNEDATGMLARQIRLRNLSGSIVVDFPRMARRSDCDRISDALSKALVDDPAAPNLLGWTRLGLMEIERPRRGPALHELVEQGD